MTAARRLLVVLILASTAVFVVGVLLERHQTAGETGETPAQRAAEAGTAGRTRETTSASQSRANGESGERHRESGEGGGSRESGERHRDSGEGSSTESSEQHSEPGESTSTTGAAAGKPAGETTEHTESGGHAESSEKLLGVNPESTGLLAVAVIVSLLLAAAVWWRGGSPVVLGVVALAMAAFCALDVREVVHQVNESRTGLAVLAAVVAALHFAVALLAARAAMTARDLPPPASPSAPAA